MSDLTYIQDHLRRTGAVMERLERDVAGNPDVHSLGLELKSFQKLHRKLEKEFEHETEMLGLEVCSHANKTPSQKTPTAPTGSLTDLVFAVIRDKWATVQVIAEQSGITVRQARGVVNAPRNKDKVQSRQNQGLTEYRLTPSAAAATEAKGGV